MAKTNTLGKTENNITYAAKPILQKPYKHTARERFNIQGGFFVKLFSIFLIIILLVVLVGRLTNNNRDISFTYLLKEFTNMPQIDLGSLSFNTSLITDDWNSFNFLRDFINLFIPLLDVLKFLGLMLVQGVLALFHLVKIIFIS